MRQPSLVLAVALSALALAMVPAGAHADLFFVPPTSFAVGDGPDSLAIGDLNSDGKSDLAALAAGLAGTMGADAAAPPADTKAPYEPDQGPSVKPSISADGRYVVFGSRDDDLSAEDNDSTVNLFVRDLQTGTATLISRATGASGAPADTFSDGPSISGDGRYVAFEATAELAGDDWPGVDVYVRDLQTNTTTLVDRATGAAGAPADSGAEAPAISADGRYVAFTSGAKNLSTQDNDSAGDVFVRDLQTDTTTLVSRASGASSPAADGYSGAPSISADGRYVAFISNAKNLSAESVPGLFVRDMQADITTLVGRVSGASGAPAEWVDVTSGNQPRYGTGAPSISADGRFVAFASAADNLSPDDEDFRGVQCSSAGHLQVCQDDRVTDIFARDLETSTTTFVSRASGAAGTAASFSSGDPSISADGRYVAFLSSADNLSAEDNDSYIDIFVRDLQTNETTLVSTGSGPADKPSTGLSRGSSISADGRSVVFTVAECRPGQRHGVDTYVRDVQAEATTLVGRDPRSGVCPLEREPDTKFTKTPRKRTTKHRAKFAFTASVLGSTFTCSLDRGKPRPCTSPVVRRVKAGSHLFSVYATDPVGNVQPVSTVAEWTVERK